MSTDAQSPPREPSAYRPSTHFPERFHDRYSDRPPRHLDDEIVRRCIEDGTAQKVNRDVYHLRETVGGVTYCLVVDVGNHEVITGYPASIDTDAARKSGRWSSRQLEEIRRFIATDPR